MWGATRLRRVSACGPGISIHAPRVGSDRCPRRRSRSGTDFNPRSPCGERRWTPSTTPEPSYFNPRSPCGERRYSIKIRVLCHLFQSTLPVWGATANSDKCTFRTVFQSTLPVWGATSRRRRGREYEVFQSTLPVWGATYPPAGAGPEAGISIHAPRVGSDLRFSGTTTTRTDFNPRSPCGERRQNSQSVSPKK